MTIALFRATNRVLARGVAVMALTALSAACGRDTVATQPAGDLAQIPWKVVLSTNVATMSTVAPYDTMQVTAKVVNAYGQVIDTATGVTFSSGDLERITVSNTGLVQIKKSGTGLPILAKYRAARLTLVDTLMVDATDDPAPPTLGTFRLLMITNQFTDVFSFFTTFPQMLQPVFVSTTGDTLSSDFRIKLTSSDPTTGFSACCGIIQWNHPGSVWFRATTTLYGVTKADSVLAVGTLPTLALELFQMSDGVATISSPSMVVKTGGSVIWLNFSDDSLDVVFDDSTHVAEDTALCHCGSGNIPTMSGIFSYSGRNFPIPGTYTFHSTIHTLTGQIVVRDE